MWTTRTIIHPIKYRTWNVTYDNFSTKQMCKSYSSNTIIDSQLNHFNQLHKQWWDEKGGLMALHAMNDLRIPFVRDGLVNSGVIQKDLSSTQGSLSNIKILDVGCGGGILTEALMRSGCLVTGIDPAQELIDVAKYHNKANNINYYPLTIEKFSEENVEKFDAVITSQVIEHICELEVFLESCVKCLKQGGSMFVTTINQTVLAWLYFIVLGEKIVKKVPPGTHEYNNLVALQRLQRIIENNNCTVQTVRGMMFNFLNDRWFFTKSTAVHYGVHAIKN
ncbi:hypothetical protein RI129_004058 [Pyrocoelia pectoralis]|uniref:Ubiquinone biosynthesis O-methyltransferase, mitochondrial n=1 Tax=Pyrocoelia pectoralis TaxID=417401 RepID=A0AAN7VQU9_9COLE